MKMNTLPSPFHRNIPALFHNVVKRLRRRIKWRALVLVLLAALFASCHTTPSQHEVGTVLFSVNSVAHWDAISNAMNPNFKLASGDEAMAKVLPVTAQIQEQVLNAFGVAAGLPAPHANVASNAALPAAPSTAATPGVDPLLQYHAAASLFQEVQLLNKEMDNISQLKGHVPYVLRMQLTTMPYRRRQPYDVYATIAFFTNFTFEKSLEMHLPFVIPLLVTDSLEQTIWSRATELAAQLRLTAGTAAEGGGSSFFETKNRKSGMASDINSLITVGRVTDTMVNVRLGAAQSVAGDYSLYGRSYNITLVVLVPLEYLRLFNGSPENPSLFVYMDATMRDAKTGKIIPEQTPSFLENSFNAAFEKAFLANDAGLYERWRRLSKGEKIEVGGFFTGNIHVSDYKTFISNNKNIYGGKTSSVAVKEFMNYYFSTQEHGFKLSLWVYLATTIMNGSIKNAYVELPPVPELEIRNEQTAVLKDDGKDKMEVVLHSISGIRKPSDISAVLTLSCRPKATGRETKLNAAPGQTNKVVRVKQINGTDMYEVMAAGHSAAQPGRMVSFPVESVAYDSTLRTVTLKFPSIKKWDVGNVDEPNSFLHLRINTIDNLATNVSLPIHWLPSVPASGTIPAKTNQVCTLATHDRQVVLGKDGSGKFTFTIKGTLVKNHGVICTTHDFTVADTNMPANVKFDDANKRIVFIHPATNVVVNVECTIWNAKANTYVELLEVQIDKDKTKKVNGAALKIPLEVN